MKTRALLWGGAADDFVDLQEALPAPWNASQAIDLFVDGDTLRILGTVTEAVMSRGYEMKAGEHPVIWEMKLLMAESPARREERTAVTSTNAPVENDERRVDRAAEAFAQAIIDDDYTAAHELLAPWLAKQVSAKQLRDVVTKEFLADTKPVDFVISGNESTLHDLRSHYIEYYKGDKARTLGAVTEYGMWGPPSLHIADEVTPENFRTWMSFDLTPEPDNVFGLDYLLRVFLIVVDVGGEMKIGYVEPGQ
jgi:hypothetical protein